jgi:hypothetical protein
MVLMVLGWLGLVYAESKDDDPTVIQGDRSSDPIQVNVVMEYPTSTPEPTARSYPTWTTTALDDWCSVHTKEGDSCRKELDPPPTPTALLSCADQRVYGGELCRWITPTVEQP